MGPLRFYRPRQTYPVRSMPCCTRCLRTEEPRAENDIPAGSRGFSVPDHPGYCEGTFCCTRGTSWRWEVLGLNGINRGFLCRLRHSGLSIYVRGVAAYFRCPLSIVHPAAAASVRSRSVQGQGERDGVPIASRAAFDITQGEREREDTGKRCRGRWMAAAPLLCARQGPCADSSDDLRMQRFHVIIGSLLPAEQAGRHAPPVVTPSSAIYSP
ncbi:hypothetical protein BD413DRAFT_59184 [Trametes elegans]|nr:hypothetical protein BD413DRAFT_59184 [Trametes elegans]